MFFDLDKPVLKDPRELVDSAMEWDAISDMYSQRDEERRRLGFVRDVHEERTSTRNPVTGRYRDLPGFNPPRRVSRSSYEDIPIELKEIIIKNVGGFLDRTPTRLISTSHAALTEGFDDIMLDVVSSVLRGDPLPETIEPWNSGRGYASNDVSRLVRTLYLVFKRMIERLGIPMSVSPADALGDVANISPSKQELPGDVNRINVSWTSSQGVINLVVGYVSYGNGNKWKSLGPSSIWKYYPTIRRMLISVPKYVGHIAEVKTKYVDEDYEKFKRKSSRIH